MTQLDMLTVYAPVGGGHKAAALAMEEAVAARGGVAMSRDLFQLAPRIVGGTYVAAHLNGTARTPNLYGKGYFSSNHRGGALEPVRLTFDRIVFGKLLREVNAYAPRVIVATHHLPLVVLGRARRKGLLHVPVVGIVTDYTAHAVWAERGVDVFCTASQLAARELLDHGVPRERVCFTGIPIREGFEHVRPVAIEPGEPLRVLITSGGFGVGPMERIVQSFAGQSPNAFELTIVCGASEELRTRVEALALRLGLRARVIGFEKNMPARLAECHLVVGKAGGLTVSETMTAGRAMIIVGTVPGNELSNERHVVLGGAGHAAVAEDVGALAMAMRDRGTITSMAERARRLVLHDASARVLGVCARLVTHNTQNAA